MYASKDFFPTIPLQCEYHATRHSLTFCYCPRCCYEYVSLYVARISGTTLEPLTVYLWLYSIFFNLGSFFSFLILYRVGRTPWRGDQPVSRPLRAHRTTKRQNKCTQTSMPCVGFELTTKDFERAKTVHAPDLSAAVIGRTPHYKLKSFLMWQGSIEGWKYTPVTFFTAVRWERGNRITFYRSFLRTILGQIYCRHICTFRRDQCIYHVDIFLFFFFFFFFKGRNRHISLSLYGFKALWTLAAFSLS
jgi:hypothetical protein